MLILSYNRQYLVFNFLDYFSVVVAGLRRLLISPVAKLGVGEYEINVDL
jgi:hypothetical protein